MEGKDTKKTTTSTPSSPACRPSLLSPIPEQTSQLRRRKSLSEGHVDNSTDLFTSARHSLSSLDIQFTSARRHLQDLTDQTLHDASEKFHSLAEQTVQLEQDLVHAFAESFLYVQRKCRHALKLYRFEDVPDHLQDNEFIRTGYRTEYSWREAWLSVVHWHNETGNIWTHLVGLIFFIGLLVAYGSWLPEHSDVWDHVIFALFILSACKCFLFSTLFHIHFCNNKKAYQTFGCLDYAGISLLIAGSTAIVTYYSFYCHALPRRTWLTVLSLISLVGLIGPMFKVWPTPKFRVWRTGIYLISGVVSATPVFHYLIQYGMPEIPSGIWGFLAMATCYIGGAAVYAFKIPERYLPGKFDFLFNSHQFWHVAVVSGAYVHYRSCMELVHWRLTQGTCQIEHPDLFAT